MQFTTTIYLLTLATGALANVFLFPAPTSGQDFHDGDTIDVAWTTTYKRPHLQLYCSYLTKRTSPLSFHVPAFAVALQNHC